MYLQGCRTFPRDEMRSGEWREDIQQQPASKLEQTGYGLHDHQRIMTKALSGCFQRQWIMVALRCSFATYMLWKFPLMQVEENRKNWKRKKVVSIEFMGGKFKISTLFYNISINNCKVQPKLRNIQHLEPQSRKDAIILCDE